jgi:hypothetical protein
MDDLIRDELNNESLINAGRCLYGVLSNKGTISSII